MALDQAQLDKFKQELGEDDFNAIMQEIPEDMTEAWLRINKQFLDWWEWSQRVNRKLKMIRDAAADLAADLDSTGDPNGDPPKNPPLG